jgi:ABC-type lipoprotein export system ATPase subunit
MTTALLTERRCVLEGIGLYHIYREAELETIALRGTDIRLHPGSWVSVVGPSGSGKSTLLHVLGGLMTPSAGQVLMDGGDVGRIPGPDRCRSAFASPSCSR